MSTIKVDTITDEAGTGAPTFSQGAAVTGNLSATGTITGSSAITTDKLTVGTTTFPTAGALSNRNLIINGAMQVAQRGGGAITSGTAYPVDRFFLTNGTAGTFSVQYSATSPENLGQSISFTVTGADASPDPTDFSSIRYKVEHNDMRHLYWGYSSASSVTLSFYVRSSVTGTHGGAIRNDSVNRAHPFSYTISSANTWERKEITISGETSGSWGSGANTGLEINWCMGAGSSRLGTSGSWNNNNNVGATGQVNLYATSGATFYITGVQLEVGDTATPFEHRSYGDQLQKCQRFYEKRPVEMDYTDDSSATAVYRTYTIPVEKRATPTIAVTSGLNYWSGGSSVALTVGSNVNINATSKTWAVNGFGLTSARGILNGEVSLDAEL